MAAEDIPAGAVAERPKRAKRPPERLGGSTPVSTPKAGNTTPKANDKLLQ